jgi:hypothetical protein
MDVGSAAHLGAVGGRGALHRVLLHEVGKHGRGGPRLVVQAAVDLRRGAGQPHGGVALARAVLRVGRGGGQQGSEKSARSGARQESGSIHVFVHRGERRTSRER